MLAKKHRLSKQAEVKQTTARGRSFFNPFFVLKIAKNDTTPRVTVIASTKVSKKAVVRNRLKRIIRDTVRKNINRMKPGDYAFIVKAKAGTVESVELRLQVQETLEKSKALQ